nr:hypothetical protein [uncultured Duganella sp.]
MRTQDRLLRKMTMAVAPLLIWAAHFFFCYAWTAMACQRGGDPAMPLAVASAVAFASVALLLARALRGFCRAAPTAPLIVWVKLVSAALALVAIAWTCVPMLMLATCDVP